MKRTYAAPSLIRSGAVVETTLIGPYKASFETLLFFRPLFAGGVGFDL